MGMNDGGAAALFGDDDQGGGSGGQTAGEVGGGSGGETGGDGGGEAPDWFAKLSAEADGDKPSHRDYAATKGFKDLDSVFKSLRETENAFRDSGRIKVPGADAKPEEVTAFRSAIGVPEKAEDYEFKIPEGHDGVELDQGLVEVLRKAAFEAGVPKGGFDALAENFIKAQLDQHSAEVTRQDSLRDAKFTEWGAEKDSKLAAAKAAGRVLGFDGKDMSRLQGAIGSDRLLEMLAKVGGGIMDDVLESGGKGSFGVTGEQAKTELDQLKSDPEFAKKNLPGTPERARWDRLNKAYSTWAAARDAAS